MQGNIEAEQEAARKKAEQEAEEAAERERQQVGCCLRGVLLDAWRGVPGGRLGVPSGWMLRPRQLDFVRVLLARR